MIMHHHDLNKMIEDVMHLFHLVQLYDKSNNQKLRKKFNLRGNRIRPKIILPKENSGKDKKYREIKYFLPIELP